MGGEGVLASAMAARLDQNRSGAVGTVGWAWIDTLNSPKACLLAGDGAKQEAPSSTLANCALIADKAER